MRIPLVVTLAILLAIPVSAANWTYRGYNEPDTALDLAIFAHYAPDVDPNPAVRKIYFSGFAKGASEGEFNANVGIVGSRIQPVETNIAAILGFWKDCNQDGYVGLIETAALEYRNDLLLDKSICPPTAPVNGQTVYPHNDGTWVREFIWIGPLKDSVGAPSNNPTNFYADGTAVWGDWGAPGAPPVLVCPGTGNFGIRSTGAILENIDCQLYYRATRALNQAEADFGLPVGGWDAQDIDNSPSPLNVNNPVYPFLYGPAEPDGHPQEGDFRGFNGGLLGRDRSTTDQRERMVTIVDCDADGPDTSPEVNLPGDVLNPATYPSLYESLNDTYEVATQNHDNQGNNPCTPSSASDQGLPYPSVEGYSEPTLPAAGRREVDHTFEFSTGSRNFPSTAVSGNCRTNQPFTQGLLGYCAPGDAGLNLYRHDGPIGPAWRTNALINLYQTTVREGLKNDGVDMGGWHATFYASVGPAALQIAQMPSATVGKYGSEACGENDTGLHNGWNCDPQVWVDRCNDPELPALPELCPRVGFTYNLRDVDCWDGTLVRGTGVRASLADLSESGPCVGHPENEGIDLP